MLKQREKRGVIGRIRTAISHYGLSANDLGLTPGSGAASIRAASKAPARKAMSVRPIKFRDEAGNTWAGRGKRPNWFKEALESGKSPEDLSA